MTYCIYDFNMYNLYKYTFIWMYNVYISGWYLSTPRVLTYALSLANNLVTNKNYTRSWPHKHSQTLIFLPDIELLIDLFNFIKYNYLLYIYTYVWLFVCVLISNIKFQKSLNWHISDKQLFTWKLSQRKVSIITIGDMKG